MSVPCRPRVPAVLPLAPLNERAEPGVRFFSGVSTYSKAFDLPAGHRRGGPLLLDLGMVGDVAEVVVNGRAVGTAWYWA